MKLRRSLASSPHAWLFSVSVAACGGASSSDLFTKPDSTTLPTQPNGNEPSSTASGSGGPGSNAPTSDASTDPPVDAGQDASVPQPDAATEEPTPSSVRCGNDACIAGLAFCCASVNNQGKPKFDCVSSLLSIACGTAVRIGCDDRTDCPLGQVCCGARDDDEFIAVGCRPSCESTENAVAVRLCDPNAAVDECAAIGQKCSSGEWGYSVCRK